MFGTFTVWVSIQVIPFRYQIIFVSIGLIIFKRNNHFAYIFILVKLSRVIFNALFGVSVNFWMALATRFLLGGLCGTLGPLRVC